MDVEIKDIVKNQANLIKVMQMLTEYAEITEKRLSVLEARPPVTVRIPKNSKLFFLAACVTSGYIGYKLADRRVQARLRELKREFEDKMTAPSTPHDKYEDVAKSDEN